MKIRAAFPNILKRQYPFVKPDYPLLTVLYLLRITEIDAVPITSEDGSTNRAIFGFSSLPRFMALGPTRFGKMLKEPCERASDELPSFAVNEDLESVLDAFASRRLGFALVHGTGGFGYRRSLISLTDMLELYNRGTIRSELMVKDVATPAFSMPKTSTIRTALQAMFRYRYRRVFLSEREYVSERSMMSYVFSPVILEELGREQGRDILATPIERLEVVRPTVVPPYTSLRIAALKLRKDRGHCLVVGKGRVATPWDVVMKPWLSRRMTIE